MKILVTGGSGFIGSTVIKYLIKRFDHKVINVDKLTYAGNKDSLAEMSRSPNYVFERVDICNEIEITEIFNKYRPNKVMHLAAESHVDRSIFKPKDFIETNVIGTFVMLNVAFRFWSELSKAGKDQFMFHHISTDEVFGDAGKTGKLFTENTAYKPSSPYSATKASSDHLVRAWHRTYELPVVLSNCSNNYGPYQYPEKLIPLVIFNALDGINIPIYGKGNQVRDWLYVEDHVEALSRVLFKGIKGETYNIGANNEKTNLEVVSGICQILNELEPNKIPGLDKYEDLITFITDRPGHDSRYAIDASKISSELGWKPQVSFETGIRKTVKWYIKNGKWWKKSFKNKTTPAIHRTNKK